DGLDRLVVLVRVHAPPWWSSEPVQPDEKEDAALARWHSAAAAVAAHVELVPVAQLELDALVDLALSRGVDLLVAASPQRETTLLLRRASQALCVAALWPGRVHTARAATKLVTVAGS